MSKRIQLDTQVYQSIMCKVSSKDGNPPVRQNVGTEIDSEGKRIYCRKVPVNNDGYDTRGGYWGERRTVYVHFTLDKSYIQFKDKKKEPKNKNSQNYKECIETYEKVLSRVDCSEGIPHGRENVGKLEDVGNKKIYSRKVRLNDITFTDRGGAYWGPGDPLYVDFTLDMSYIYFHREHYGSLFDIDKL